MRRNAMPGHYRLRTMLVTSALAIAVGATVTSAQQPLPPLPKPDTPPPVPPILQNYKPVTADRLKQPEDGDWLMYRRTYDGWGYSPLSQITTENAAKLKPVWTLATGQIEGHQAPPIVNNGVMLVATPGNQLLAIDAKAGNLLWRFKRPIPEDMLLLHPTSRGVGLLGDKGPGDNLYTSSVIGLDTATGKIKGFHQYHPNDSWDWDEVSPPILVDYQHNGKTIKGLVDVARDGYLWMLERSGDKINFVDGKPFVKQNVFTRLDPETGRPEVDPARQPATGKKADFCPSLWGGKGWPPVAYSPKTKLLYIPANENLCGTITGEPATYTPGQRYVGATSTMYIAPGADHIGELQAWNLDTGQKVWSHPFANSQLWGPVLATAAGNRRSRAAEKGGPPAQERWAWTPTASTGVPDRRIRSNTLSSVVRRASCSGVSSSTSYSLTTRRAAGSASRAVR